MDIFLGITSQIHSINSILVIHETFIARNRANITNHMVIWVHHKEDIANVMLVLAFCSLNSGILVKLVKNSKYQRN